MQMRQALRRHARLLAALALLATSASHAQPISVRVERQGDEVVIDVEARVQVASKHVWAVLTDYDHMADFLSTMTKSSVIERRGNSLKVAQAGEQQHGPFHFAFDTVRAVDLVPGKEIRSRLVKGSFKSYDSTTRLVEQGAVTLVVHHGRYVPDTWVPPVIGPSVIRDKAEQQYRELIVEMIKRQQAAVGTKLP